MTDGARVNIVGKIYNKRTFQYQNGSRKIEFYLSDTTGDIVCVAWDDASDLFSNALEDYMCYELFNVPVKKNERLNRLEVRLYATSQIEKTTDIDLDHMYENVRDNFSEGLVRAQGVLSDISTTVEKMNQEEIFRAVIISPKGMCHAVIPTKFCGDMSPGNVVRMDSTFKGTKLFAFHVEKTSDETLSNWWENIPSNDCIKKRRFGTEYKISDLMHEEVGCFVELCGVIHRKSITPIEFKNRHRYNFAIVDDSMSSIDVSYYCNSNESFDVDIGDVVRIMGEISSFNTKSINTNMYVKQDSHKLVSWYSNNNDKNLYNNLSVWNRAS